MQIARRHGSLSRTSYPMNAFVPEVAVVAGVGPGLGASLARRLATAGCRIGLLARTSEFIEALAIELRDKGSQTLAVPADVSQPDQVATAFRSIREQFGPVDLLINNASASGPFGQPFTEITADSFVRGWQVGVLGAFLCSQTVVPDMLVKGSGCILFTGATSSVRGAAITFSSAKFALRGLAQGLARELWPRGIHIAHVIVDGVIREREIGPGIEDQAGEPLMNPAAIAEVYWDLAKQDRSAWTLELDLRPHREKFFE
jgi:NAD(P)-dependent dehydrogenase (short-subunit alcohol dehydrogenase family)